MYLGIDLGTGSVKVMRVGGDGQTQVASASYPIEAPQSGFSETDPAQWIRAIRQAVAELSARSDLSSLRGIRFSGQMHGSVLLDQADQSSLGRAILWSDQRGRHYLEPLKALGPKYQAQLLNAPASGMSASTLLWLKHEQPALYAKIRTVLLPKDYIRFMMTGHKATDYSDASGSLLYDFKARNWYSEAIHALGLSEAYLPPIHAAIERAGTVNTRGAELFGLPEGVPVAIGGGDAPVGMFGSDLLSSKQVQISVGTAAQISRPIAADRLPVWNGALNVFEGIRTSDRYQVAAMLNAGIALEWVCRVLKRDWADIYAALEGRDLSQAPDLLFLPYLSGERTPYMNPQARGAWIGLSLHHTDSDLALAALIGVACTLRLGLETLGMEGVDSIRAVGGSLRYEYWRNLLASVIGQPITIFEQTDISARGAVRIAAEMLGESLPSASTNAKVYAGQNLPWIADYFARFKKAYQLLGEL